MLIDTEDYVNENGVNMRKECFGQDKEHITTTVIKPIPDKPPEDTGVNPDLEKEVSDSEIQAQILLNQAEIIAKQQEQDEVLAEIFLQQTVQQQEQDEVLAAILLNQIGGGEEGV